jgi:hypothetical protein
MGEQQVALLPFYAERISNGMKNQKYKNIANLH